MKNETPILSPIKLYWWNDHPNFGDALNPILVQHVSGRPVEWAPNTECELFALGSIMKQARRGFSKAKDYKPAIWGTGMIGPQRLDFLGNVSFSAVRGPATAALLGINFDAFGDPGLLVSELVSDDVKRGDDIGIIPHHGQFSNPKTAAALDHLKTLPFVKIIDARANDAMHVVRQIQSCRHIFSESLHGLIVADSLEIPNTWLHGGVIHSTPKFKCLDYFLSIAGESHER
jgi:pyruvyltransferase